MDAWYGLATILRDARKSALLRMRSELFHTPSTRRTRVRTRRIGVRRRKARSRRRARGSTARIPTERSFGDFRDARERAKYTGRLDGKHQDLLVRRMGDLREGAQVLVGDEVVYRSDLALGDRLAHDFSGHGLGRGGALACLGVTKRGFTAAFGLENLSLFGALGPENRGLPLAFRGQYFSTLLALGLHLPAHRLDEVCGRHDVLDLNAVDLDAPGRYRGIDDAQQTLVDFVAMRQHLIQVHGAHHGSDVGHGELDDGRLER